MRLSQPTPKLEAVIAPTLLDGWVNFGGTYQNTRYWKNAQGEIEVAVALASGTLGVVMFTLPVGYRPAARVACAGWGTGGVAEVNVHSSGSFDAGSAAGNTRVVAQITYRTD